MTTTAIGAIPPRFMGLSYEKLAMSYGYFHPSNHNLIALFRRLGAGVLRIGGGSVDQLLWTSSSTGTHAQISSTNIKDLAGFLQATGWLCLYAINLATSTPALAAEEASFAASALGSNLLGIEIGNEPDEYGVAGNYFAGNWTFQEFLSRWDLFRAAILQAAPHVPITGPATGGGNHISTWTLPFGQAVTPSELTLLTQHYYRASGASSTSTASFLISPDPQLTGELATLKAGAQQLGIPYRISECNSFSNGGAAGVSDSYASSLWVIDFLFNVALGGATGVNMHGGGQPWLYSDRRRFRCRDRSATRVLWPAVFYPGRFRHFARNPAIGRRCRRHGLRREDVERRPEPDGGQQRHAAEPDPHDTDQPAHPDSKHANDDGTKPGCYLRSHDPGRHGEQGRQFCSGKPGHADSLSKPDNLLHPGTQRRAYQHHLI